MSPLLSVSLQAGLFVLGVYLEKAIRKRFCSPATRKQIKPTSRILTCAIVTVLILFWDYWWVCSPGSLGLSTCFYLDFSLSGCVHVLVANSLLFARHIYEKFLLRQPDWSSYSLKSLLIAPALEELLFRAAFYRASAHELPVWLLALLFSLWPPAPAVVEAGAGQKAQLEVSCRAGYLHIRLWGVQFLLPDCVGFGGAVGVAALLLQLVGSTLVAQRQFGRPFGVYLSCPGLHGIGRFMISRQLTILSPSLQMHRDPAYEVFHIQRQPPSLSPPHTARPRLKSLQTIKVTRKGLPPDFFRHPDTHRVCCTSRLATLPASLEDRGTPKFLEAVTVPVSRPRECKSQERIGQAFRPSSKQVTFSRPFFCEQTRGSPRRTARGKAGVVGEEGGEGWVPQKQQLTIILKRRQLDREKYPYVACLRRHQRGGSSRLPVLRARFPSGMGP